MAGKKEKKEFDWNAGSKLTEDLYDPVGNIRDVGFEKLADGYYVDPVLRKKARKKKLNRTLQVKKEGELFVEESESGLSDNFTPSDASRLIGRSNDIHGIERFQKSHPIKPKNPK